MPMRQTRAPWLNDSSSGGISLPLRNHLDHRDVGTFVEELRGGEIEDPVVLDDEQEPVLRPADSVRHLEVERRRERLDLVGDVVAVAVGDRPHHGLARADEQHVGGRRHRHVPGIRYDRIQLDLESRGQLDALEILLDRIGVASGLWHRRDVEVGGRDLHLLQRAEILRLLLCHSEPGRERERDCKRCETHGLAHDVLLICLREKPSRAPFTP